MLEQAEDILEGARIILKVLGLPRAFIGIEANKPDAIAHMGERCRALAAPVEVVALKVKYPQGAEKQLIKAVLNREVPSGGLPFDVGVIVQNVGTALAVYEAVVRGKPLIERVLTVSGDGVKERKNLLVRIGTPFSEVIAFCGGIAPDADGSQGERRDHGRAHDGPVPVHPRRARGEGHQRHPRAGEGRAGRTADDLHQVRPLRGDLPHGPDAQPDRRLRGDGEASPSARVRREGLHRVRGLRVRLRRPAGPSCT